MKTFDSTGEVQMGKCVTWTPVVTLGWEEVD